MKALPKLIIGGCPRCKGTLAREQGYYDCLQCGYIRWDDKPQRFQHEGYKRYKVKVTV
jgi:hypothetical protein